MVDLTAALRGENVSESDTIQRIDIDLIDDDPKNFYQLTNLDELAANIAMVGLQDPIRVRENPDQRGRYIIVSGHRRRAAIRKLVEEDGREDLRKIPCIREMQSGSPALQELRLIYANSDTRQLTSAEIGQQAERVEALLYQLKEEGVEFPGRMRDHVAEACKISRTKLARLKVIENKLILPLANEWNGNYIPESVAYRLAQEAPEIQRSFCDKWMSRLEDMTELQVDTAIDIIKHPPQIPQAPAPKAGSTAQAEAQAYVAELEEENGRFYRAMEEHGFDWLLSQMRSVGQSRRDGIDALKRGPAFTHSSYGCAGYHMDCEPKGFRIQIKGEKEIRRSWTEVWDTMAVLALETSKFFSELDEGEDEREEEGPTGQLVFAGWMPGGTTPSKPCDVVAKFDLGNGNKTRMILHWDGKVLRFTNSGQATVDMVPLKWMALPPDEDEEEDHG